MTKWFAVSLIAAGSVACGGRVPSPGAATPVDAPTLTLRVQTPDLTEGAKVVLVWHTVVGSDQLRIHGVGSVGADGTATISLVGPPPPAVLNTIGADTFGIGVVAVVAADAPMEEGDRIEGQVLVNEAQALSTRHAVIWRAGALHAEVAWMRAFTDAAFSCGVCVDGDQSDEAKAHDTFAPVACEQVGLPTDLADIDEQMCDWN